MLKYQIGQHYAFWIELHLCQVKCLCLCFVVLVGLFTMMILWLFFFHRKKRSEWCVNIKSKKWWSGLGCWLVQVKIKAADWPVYTASYIPTWSSPAAHCHCPVAKSMDRCRGRLGGVDAAVAVAELLVVRPRLNGGAVCDTWPSGERQTRTKIIK